ncbi:MAG: hypothetical protein ACRENS_12000, partial [Candidatus Eiseniibacteriota bacterium]
HWGELLCSALGDGRGRTFLAKADNHGVLEETADHVSVRERSGVAEHGLADDIWMVRQRSGKAIDEFSG